MKSEVAFAIINTKKKEKKKIAFAIVFPSSGQNYLENLLHNVSMLFFFFFWDNIISTLIAVSPCAVIMDVAKKST